MSAPATNVRPAPMTTMASVAASALASATAALESADDFRGERVDGRVVDADDGHRRVTRQDVEVTGHLRGERG